MSIKPLAWINADNTMAGIPSVLTEYGPNRRPLYAIPDTHRVVPVDDLRAVLLLDQTKDAEQRMDARNRLVKAAKDQS